MLRLIIDHAAVQGQIVIARDHAQWIDLHGFAIAQRLRRALRALPAPTGPQALPAQQIAARRRLSDSQLSHVSA